MAFLYTLNGFAISLVIERFPLQFALKILIENVLYCSKLRASDADTKSTNSSPIEKSMDNMNATLMCFRTRHVLPLYVVQEPAQLLPDGLPLILLPIRLALSPAPVKDRLIKQKHFSFNIPMNDQLTSKSCPSVSERFSWDRIWTKTYSSRLFHSSVCIIVSSALLTFSVAWNVM